MSSPRPLKIGDRIVTPLGHQGVITAFGEPTRAIYVRLDKQPDVEVMYLPWLLKREQKDEGA